jgi:hypothetical protein
VIASGTAPDTCQLSRGTLSDLSIACLKALDTAGQTESNAGSLATGGTERLGRKVATFSG